METKLYTKKDLDFGMRQIPVSNNSLVVRSFNCSVAHVPANDLKTQKREIFHHKTYQLPIFALQKKHKELQVRV